MRKLTTPLAGALAILLAAAPKAAAQAATVGDSLRLGELHESAVQRDPRARQFDLLAAQSALRSRNLAAEKLPAFSLNAEGQYRSQVVELPFSAPGAVLAAQPHDSYDAHLAARQRLFDPAAVPRTAAERARLAEAISRVKVSMHGVRQQVNDAFFGALLLQAQRAVVEGGITELEARLGVAASRVRLGAALPSEVGMLEAALLERRQLLDELATNRQTALIVLGSLADREVAARSALAIPELADRVSRARAALPSLRERPEYEQFTSTRESLARQRDVIAARNRPRVSAFARAGYGRPALNPLATRFDEYWTAGLQLEWTPWNWNATSREREELAIQQRIVATEEDAFSESLQRAVENELAAMDRLERSLMSDERIISLREEILRETRARFAEGVVTAAEYVDRDTELLDAQLAHATHRVELARAHARFLTLVGLEVRE